MSFRDTCSPCLFFLNADMSWFNPSYSWSSCERYAQSHRSLAFIATGTNWFVYLIPNCQYAMSIVNMPCITHVIVLTGSSMTPGEAVSRSIPMEGLTRISHVICGVTHLMWHRVLFYSANHRSNLCQPSLPVSFPRMNGILDSLTHREECIRIWVYQGYVFIHLVSMSLRIW